MNTGSYEIYYNLSSDVRQYELPILITHTHTHTHNRSNKTVCIYIGMELFASCLWHLRCDVELSVLTDTLLTSDPCRVEGMCAKATSLNLARDHDGAVRCLQKAIAVSVE